jgi:diadenosine tetraphosphate (Ap4A) HIT family hydrolase
MTTLIHRYVEQARQGNNSTIVCQVPSGWVMLGNVQFLRGYSLLLPDPVVPDLDALDVGQRATFLRDMTLLGDALLEVTGAARINYEILGNSEPALHAHVIPRYASEPEDKRRGPAWFYDWKNGPPFDLERDRELMRQIAVALQRRLEIVLAKAHNKP